MPLRNMLHGFHPLRLWRRWEAVIRSSEWLGITFLPLFTSFYYILLTSERGYPRLFLEFGYLLVFGCCCTAFAFVLNSLTDRHQDLKAKKHFEVATWRSRKINFLLAGLTLGCLLSLAALVFEPAPFYKPAAEAAYRLGFSFWNGESAISPSQQYAKLPVILIGCSVFVISIAYSVPPLRVKERGWLGPVAIGVSQFGLPQLMLFALLDSVSLLGWAMALLFTVVGLRLILLHQILDAANDIAAQVDTVVVSLGVEKVFKLMLLVLAPLEMLFLAVCLVLIQQKIPYMLFAAGASVGFFLLFAWLRGNYSANRAPVLIMAPLDFYWLLWPVFFLFYGLGLQAGLFAPLLVLHILMSRHVWGEYWQDIKALKTPNKSLSNAINRGKL